MAGVGLILFAFIISGSVLADKPTHLATSQPRPAVYQSGDVRYCLESKNPDVERFEVLPGTGWDNLRNVEAGQVMMYNYSECRTTQDGRFLVPDSVNTIPLKESNVQLFAELVDHWTNFTSTTSHGINIDAGLQLTHVGISGHFSTEYQHVKSEQINDQSVTTRVQLRYVRYKTTLQPDSPLHPSFKSRLLDIAVSLQMNQTEQARYQSQILIRDFGTHVISAADAGAALVQVDQVSRNYANKYVGSKSTITAGASASFFGIVHFSASYTTKSSEQTTDEYRKSRTTSKISTYGGPMFQAANYTANDWTSDVSKGLVAIDRWGDPLSFLVTPANLPDLPTDILNGLQDCVAAAIELYYEYNTYRGCTKMDSPNFSPLANVDDGSCKATLTNMTFGGVYQTCSLHEGSNYGNICYDLKLDQLNPKTGQHSCPAHYQSVELHAGTVSRATSRRNCYSCYLFFTCCNTDYLYSAATYTMYWCAAKGSVPQDSGYLFGGVYTDHVMNPITGSAKCPDTYYARQLATNMFICISDDFEQGAKYAVPLGGFMSCEAGNPLALKGKGDGIEALQNGVPSLNAFYRSSVPADWPKHCPKGFSKHLAYMDQECAINYCAKTGAFSGNGLPAVRRPPFVSQPAKIGLPKIQVIFDPKTKTWRKNEAANQYKIKHPSQMTPGAAAGISIFVTLACVAVATIVVVVFRRKMNSRKRGTSSDTPPLYTPQNNYGSNDTEGDDVTIQVQS